MTTESTKFRHRRMRAPAKSGEALFVPDLSTCKDLIRENRQLRSSQQFTLNKSNFATLRAAASAEVQKQALEYTRQYRDIDATTGDTDLVVMSGHQPQLFHPGVWFKNFVLSDLSQEIGALAINLVIDNDLCGVTKIPVPTGSIEQPKIVRVAFDQGGRSVPFENRRVNDEETFKSFARRTKQVVSSLARNPLLDDLWPKVLDTYALFGNLGQAIAAGRHIVEDQFKLDTLELPLSKVCETYSFAQFVTAVVQRIDEFHRIYNQVIQDYRSFYRIKNQSQPLPELGAINQYLETPFWIWNHDSPARRPLYVRVQGNTVELSNGERVLIKTPIDELAQHVIESTDQLAIRPRALATTMYCRMFLCDLFIHGIGGAKYDELTDKIAESFFEIRLPGYLTTTATMRFVADECLPTTRPTDSLVRLRELTFHPERFIEDPERTSSELINRKTTLLKKIPKSNGNKKAWHNELVSVNHQLEPFVADQRKTTQTKLKQQVVDAGRYKVLGSREFSFCLFERSLPVYLKSLIESQL